MTDEQRKRVAELTEFIHSQMIDTDKFHIAVSDCLLLLESQWEDYCAGSEQAFQIQREKDLIDLMVKEHGDV